ncbi:MAG: glycogen synthase GlgA [Gammaproteobacteria bacterium]|nr:glycogen synthase GlgA [Gammaproteobacteria bacterium]
MNKILYVCSEAFPLIKTGGLADVAGSLPAALLSKSQDVRLVLPAYPEVLSKIKKQKIIAKSQYYMQSVNIIETKLPGTKVITWLIDCPAAFNRPGGPYTDQHGDEWHDNAFRYTILCHAAVDLSLNRLSINWQPNLVHCNDWQTGLVPALLSLYINSPKTIFTIHNIAYQGNFDQQMFNDLHLPKELWHMHGVEYYGKFSFMKAGIAYANKITTVSPNYAKEILTDEFGYGLSGLLNHRKDDLSGIVNGIDEKHWNPGTDELIVQKYNQQSLPQKVINKTALQKELKLANSKKTPLIGMVSRLVEQKGLNLILEHIETIISNNKVQFVILGAGNFHYEMLLCELAEKYPKQLSVTIGYNEALAHQIEAASDLFLMPSTFEPCGLNQLYSLRYGTLPIVTPVGGLVDTVIPATSENIQNNTANGFMLEGDNLVETIEHALSLYQQAKTWKQLQLTAMKAHFTWKNVAGHYIQLYDSLKSS